MAKINGIELKAVKEFIGMDGYGFSANIYMDGKRVGTVNDEADGRCYYYFFTSNGIEKQIMERMILPRTTLSDGVSKTRPKPFTLGDGHAPLTPCDRLTFPIFYALFFALTSFFFLNK